jgi:hypothetical protein
MVNVCYFGMKQLGEKLKTSSSGEAQARLKSLMGEIGLNEDDKILGKLPGHVTPESLKKYLEEAVGDVPPIYELHNFTVKVLKDQGNYKMPLKGEKWRPPLTGVVEYGTDKAIGYVCQGMCSGCDMYMTESAIKMLQYFTKPSAEPQAKPAEPQAAQPAPAPQLQPAEPQKSGGSYDSLQETLKKLQSPAAEPAPDAEKKEPSRAVFRSPEQERVLENLYKK